MDEPGVIGWDIGGAHVKAARLQGGRVLDVAQWPCPLWQGMSHLDEALASARSRWPALAAHRHAVTMTGEMVDLFEHREDGVARIASHLAQALPDPRFYAGDAGWCDAAGAAQRWSQVASANWLAAAGHAARRLPDREGVWVDIGSTTTDLIVFRHGRVPTASRTDAQRLHSGELVYQGVVRTPLCALASRIPWQGRPHNVMNEFFATTADVYRLTAELDPAHDQQPAADGAPKDAPHTRARLARLIGLDERDGSPEQWLDFARAWRRAQVDELRAQFERVRQDCGLAPGATVVRAGCGAFLVEEVCPPGWRHLEYARDVVRIDDAAHATVAAWVQIGAPAVAVASLWAEETR